MKSLFYRQSYNVERASEQRTKDYITTFKRVLKAHPFKLAYDYFYFSS